MRLGKGRAADLYHEHSADAVRLAYLVTGDRHLAEDLAQDAFVRAFGRFQDLRAAEAFGPYVKRTIVNLSRDHFRRLQRERAFSLRQHQAETEDGDRLGSPDARDEPLGDELLEALQRVAPRQRAAIVLRYCEGMSERETAEVLTTSVGAVNSLVTRGLAALRANMRGGNHE